MYLLSHARFSNTYTIHTQLGLNDTQLGLNDTQIVNFWEQASCILTKYAKPIFNCSLVDMWNSQSLQKCLNFLLLFTFNLWMSFPMDPIRMHQMLPSRSWVGLQRWSGHEAIAWVICDLSTKK